MAEYYVERQCWQHWPKTLIMCRRTGRMDNGDVAVQRRRYVPERPKVKKVRGFGYDAQGAEYDFLACSGCCAWIDGDLDLIGEMDGPNFCHSCGGEFDGPLLCRKCGKLADIDYGDMCAECANEEL